MAQNGVEPQGAGLGEDFDLDADLLRNIAAALENNQLADQGQHAANQAGQPGVQLPAVQLHAVQQAAGIQPSPELDAFLENALRRSEERLASRFKDQLSSTVEDVLSSSLANKKRKADQLKNEGIKKQYVPLEEANLRMKAFRESLADATLRENLLLVLTMPRSCVTTWMKVFFSSKNAWLILKLLSMKVGMLPKKWRRMLWFFTSLTICNSNSRRPRKKSRKIPRRRTTLERSSRRGGSSGRTIPILEEHLSLENFRRDQRVHASHVVSMVILASGVLTKVL
jgi:hypothetical protein